MANVLVDEASLQGIATAIRGKNGTQNTYTPGQMAAAITAIPSGGGSSYKLIASAEYQVSTTQTSAASVADLACDLSDSRNKNKIIYVKVRDKAGKRAGYFLGSDTFFANVATANGDTTANQVYGTRLTYKYNSSNKYEVTASGSTVGYGVYAYGIAPNGSIAIYRKYNNTESRTVDGTYKVEVYKLDWPGNVTPFDI